MNVRRSGAIRTINPARSAGSHSPRLSGFKGRRHTPTAFHFYSLFVGSVDQADLKTRP